MRYAVWAGAAAVLLASGPAKAEPPSGVELGLRTGYAVPFGKVDDGTATGQGGSLGDEYTGVVPLGLDAGYRLASPNLFLGAYFQYGVALVAGSAGTSGVTCSTAGVSCTGNVLTYGIEAQLHLLPEAKVDPWVGLGVGLESASEYFSANGVSGSSGASGWDYLTLMAGADLRVGPNLGLGPFVDLALGEYGSESLSQAGSVTTSGVQDPALHGWLTFGVRGVYDLRVP